MIIQSKVNNRLFTYDKAPLMSGIGGNSEYVTNTVTENISPVLQRNYLMREGLIERPKNETGHLIGSIPETVYAALIKERPEFLTDDKALKNFLRSDEGAAYRTYKGGL